MEQTEMIVLDDFCTNHQVEVSFVRSLEDYGLLQTIIVNETLCVAGNELPKLEQILRLYRELNINSEGIDVVINLLQRIESMQNEMNELKNKLNFYESQ